LRPYPQPPVYEVIMADRALRTSRRALLGAAAAIPFLPLQTAGTTPVEGPSHPPTAEEGEWNRRLTRYRHLAARAKAAAETGWFRAANDRYYWEAADPGTDSIAAFARLDRAENLYWQRYTEPTEEASIRLVLTKAPHFTAIAIKLALIQSHHLTELEGMERNCWAVLAEDVQRLHFALQGSQWC
jgi:hypothetical protein